MIIDKGGRYIIEKGLGKLDISVFPQTSGTSDELNANPEHINIQAYNELAQQVYPWQLPFDLWNEEADIYLEHLGIHRYDLMQKFQKLGPSPDPTDIAIANEYLGLSTKEWQILTGTGPEKVWEFWGYPVSPTPGTWVTDLAQVRFFLERSGLKYEELTSLLETSGFTTGWYAAQSDWNNGAYSYSSGGDPNQGCNNHTQQYCNGYYDGYTKLWAQWQYNLAHGLNLVNSPQQTQGSDVNTNIKGNGNTITNIINQGQASNSPNSASSGYGGNR
jgi:hypothetical protein